MRLKSLRKEQPVFEVQGALVRGSRINISNNDISSPRFRAEPDVEKTDETKPEPTTIVEEKTEENKEVSSYKAIEAAYREHGICIRLTPTKAATPTSHIGGRRSALSLRRPSTFSNRNPSRTSSVLNYSSNKPEFEPVERSFSALQNPSGNVFENEQTRSLAFTQSTEISEVPTISGFTEDSSNVSKTEIQTEKSLPPLDSSINDPDFAYMSSLLTTSAGESYREMIRRRAGLRDTFAVHRHPVTLTPQQHNSRGKSPLVMHRSSTFNTSILSNGTTPTPTPTLTSEKIDKDIVKHASRLRMSYYKDYQIKTGNFETTSRVSSSSKSSSIHRNFQTMSLMNMAKMEKKDREPLELLLSRRAARSASLLSRDLPSIVENGQKSWTKRKSSAKMVPVDRNNPLKSLTKESNVNSSTTIREHSSIMKSPSLNHSRQTNSFDSGYYDRSSSGGDIQSFTSSVITQAPSLGPTVRINSSTTRRSNATKKVSFYEEPTSLLPSAATYV